MPSPGGIRLQPRGRPRPRRRGARIRPSILAVGFVVVLLLGSLAAAVEAYRSQQAKGAQKERLAADARMAGGNDTDALAPIGPFWQAMQKDLRAPLSLRDVLGPAADMLLRPGTDSLMARDAPANVPAALDQVMGPSWGRVPLPSAPDGPEPLLAALHALSLQKGVDLPSDEVLRAGIAALRLQSRAEEALAKLLMAYQAALQLENQAVRDLGPDERLLVEGEPGAVQAWLAADPVRTPDDYQAMVARLSATRIDLGDRVRAADLLVRAIDEVKGDLSLPAAPLVSVPRETLSAALPSDAEPVLNDTLPVPFARQAGRNIGAPWGEIESIVDLASGVRDPSLPALPEESLAVAIRNLAWVLGYPAGPVPIPPIEMPSTLSNALAGIVTARRIGLQAGDPAVHTLLLLEATRRAEPTLRAWAAMMTLTRTLGSAQTFTPAVARLMTDALSPGTAPSSLLASREGLTVPAQPPTAASLVALLSRYGVPVKDAGKAAGSLPTGMAPTVATILGALDDLQRANAAGVSGVDVKRQQVLARSPEVVDLLQRTQWTKAQADLVASWAAAMTQLHQDGAQAAADSARIQLLATLEPATTDLGAELGVPVPGLFGTMSVTDPPSCPTSSPLSDCTNDVWLYTPQGGGLLVTGFQSSVVDLRYGNPRLTIDLGGADRYLSQAGGAAGSEVSVVVDVAGDDTYDTDAPVAQGAAQGLGAVGILWDMGGNDRYVHARQPGAAVSLAQGAGSAGGLGVLVDAEGSDTYDAPASDAQGSGWGAASAGGIGILLDRGPGGDVLRADRGQGYASGGASLGILVNEQGTNSYQTSKANPNFQGGITGGTGTVGILVDLGGHDTTYSNGALPSDVTFRGGPGVAAGRTNDALWVERASPAGLGVGLDSTTDDDDKDGFPNVVELLAGSDPQNATSQPGVDGANGLLGLVTGLVGTPPDPNQIIADPTTALSTLGFADFLLCQTADVPCTKKMSILQVNGTGKDNIATPSEILIDLGGDDTYTSEVAGPANFYVSGDPHHGVGSYALDLSGNDDYATPGMDWTQGSVEVNGNQLLNPSLPDAGSPSTPGTPEGAAVTCALNSANARNVAGSCNDFQVIAQQWAQARANEYANTSVALGSTASMQPVSVLLDAAGDDHYEASRFSQGSAASLPATCTGGFGGANVRASGAAFLIDISGNDTYSAQAASQASVRDDGGVGSLLDLSGNDSYEFFGQATSYQTTAGICTKRSAFLFDGGGTDIYNSTSVVVNTDGLTSYASLADQATGAPVNYRNAFVTQGDVDTTTVSAGGSNAQGVFVDQGEAFDQYITRNQTDAFPDVSRIKNDQIVRNELGHAVTLFSDGTAWFADPAVVQDPDNDGAATLLERTFGTNPRDAQSSDGSLWGAPSRLDGVGGNPSGATPDQVTRASGADDAGFWLRWPGVLAIGGRGDKILNEAFDLVVSLGGNNTYVSPHVAGSTTTGAVTVLVDAGPGNTSYVPDGKRCIVTVAGSAQACTSLGAATDGVAVLADAGGENTFLTDSSVSKTDQGPLTFDILTQGAAINNAAGFLVTWNSTNRFEARLHMAVQKSPGGQPLNIGLNGVAQGASRGGVGLLASLGDGNDTYSVEIDSNKPALNRSVAQGAASGRFGSVASQSLTPAVRLVDEGAYGILIDSGGSNTFRAPDGFSQGFGEGGLGVLWAGKGDDTFVASGLSQGAGRGSGGTGILYDGGGEGRFDVLATKDATSTSQGAGSASGVGILVTTAGDDRYDAAGMSQVQGSGIGGTGLLIDLGGSDLYRAAGKAQAYVEAAGAPQAAGMLFDAQGDDVYDLRSGVGQGAGEATCGSGTFSGLFVDVQGDDTYRHPHPEQKVPVSGLAPRDDGNDGAWSQPGTASANCPFGLGVDAQQVDTALEQIRSSPLPVGVQRVAFQAWEGASQLPNGAAANGDILLRALVQSQPPDPNLVDRVTFVSDAGPLGLGTFAGVAPDGLRYDYVWHTGHGAVDDGLYSVRAAVYVHPAQAEGAEPLGHPDLPALDSDVLRILADNPPTLTVDSTGLGADPMMRPGGARLPLVVSVGADYARPAGANPGPSCNADPRPGGFLSIDAINGTQDYSVFAGYCDAGALTVYLDGRDGDGNAWTDGTYDLTVRVQDPRGQLATVTWPDVPRLTIDGKAPHSAVLLTGYANRANRGAGTGTLLVPWAFTDFGGSGVKKACLFQLDSDNGLVSEPQCPNVHTPPAPVPIKGVQTGDLVRLVSSTQDRVGNAESPCDVSVQEEANQLCYQLKAGDDSNVANVRVDFTNPIVSNVRASGQSPSDTYVRPGAPVNFTADVTDEGTGVVGVAIDVPGIGPTLMDTDRQGHFWYDGWSQSNQHLHDSGPREETFALTITAQDKAGNVVPQSFASHLDSLAPRVSALPTQYVEPSDSSTILAAGRPGLVAVVRALIDDAAVGLVSLDTHAVATSASVECTPPSGFVREWRCLVPLRQDVADGDYALPLRATDVAGNVATAAMPVLVRGLPLELQDIRLAHVGPDHFLVAWTTPFPGTSRVDYGRTGLLGQSAQDSQDRRTEHLVNVTGLSPGTAYWFEVVSESESGRVSVGPLLPVTTANAFDFLMAPFPEAPRHGVSDFPFEFHSTTISGPVAVVAKIEDVGRNGSPVDFATLSQDDGAGALTVNTTRFPDGTYRLVLHLQRGPDLGVLTTPTFEIDNTAPVVQAVFPHPGSRTNERRPLLEVALRDPGAGLAPSLSTLVVREAGLIVNVTATPDPSNDPSSLMQRGGIQLLEDLSEGLHELDVSALDAAGNEGIAAFILFVDASPPAAGPLVIEPLPGPRLAMAGGYLHLAVPLDDPAGVTRATVGAADGLFDGSLALLGRNGTWEGDVPIRSDASAGHYDVTLNASDALGNEGQVARFEITVDNTPPGILSATVNETAFTSALLQVVADRPVIAWRAEDPAPDARNSTAWAATQTLEFVGLRPGADQPLAFAIMDEAGHIVEKTVSVSTPADQEPPAFGMPVLKGVSDQEGVVALAWSAASDNLAIDHYLVERARTSHAAAASFLLPAKTTSFLDEAAPAGRQVVYRVFPVDSVGLAGAPITTEVAVLALPHLSNPSVSPERGPSDRPFLFRVQYAHAGGLPPESLTLTIDGRAYPLSMASNAGSCERGCTYEGSLMLPAASLRHASQRPEFRADVGGRSVNLTMKDSPFVSGGAATDWQAAAKNAAGAPTLGPLGVVAGALLAAWATFRPKRRRHP